MHDPESAQKNWNFLKAHLGKHVFQDIIEKGAAWNYSTRPNESQHGPIWKYYLCQMNRKDMPEQVRWTATFSTEIAFTPALRFSSWTTRPSLASSSAAGVSQSVDLG